jgi:phosphonate transport system substrate-binding protein
MDIIVFKLFFMVIPFLNLSNYSNIVMIAYKQTCKMKKLPLLLTLAMIACSFPVQWISGTPTPTITPTLTVEAATPVVTSTPPATAQPGSTDNPLILALAPSARPSQAMINAGDDLVAQLEALTGYKFVTVAPTSEAKLVEAVSKGDVEIMSLSPFGYLLAYENEDVSVALASVRDGQTLYGAQFIAHRDSEFTSFNNKASGENTAEAAQALSQFKDKKPCWSDLASPSGYVVPLGFLNQAGVSVESGAFLQGQPSVVRAVYAADICDFGATFIDARTLPALEASYPDVMDKVNVIWKTPAIIPYENISFALSVPLEVRRVLLRAFVDLMLTPEGRTAIQTVYGIEALQPAEDDLYKAFGIAVKDARLDLNKLIEAP